MANICLDDEPELELSLAELEALELEEKTAYELTLVFCIYFLFSYSVQNLFLRAFSTFLLRYSSIYCHFQYLHLPVAIMADNAVTMRTRRVMRTTVFCAASKWFVFINVSCVYWLIMNGMRYSKLRS